MKFIQDTFTLVLLFIALYFVALGIKYTVNVIPQTLHVTLEEIR